ncbi:MAG: efflux RND transporter periplasmic adaptor subunit [Arcobacter sp.]|uniref:efflux RND transporter periplasmic adaptor subunit n=1 Tax=Arcobacter sp. TaxID=1872629 RepID=UPI002A75DDB5|nr:efflux RND transporter periplasmic adaptor subunit [Arcobacter sp.]MDY3200091.1 efflux RND transporter periplasmic adaptor subunit [Arcobacter sp.]
MIKISKLSFFILTILFILSGCEEKDSQSAQTKQSIEVGTITIKEQPIALQQELSGRVKAKLVSEVRPQINGIIEKQFFIEGSKVTQGDILYQIDSSSYEAIYNQEKAALQSAKATLQSAKLKSQRYDELLKVDGISKQETDDAKASYLEALALVEEKKAALESAKINLERTKIKAPISGYIGISTITQGALVSANQTTALTTIRDTNTVYVDLNQSQTQLLALKKLLTKKNIKEGNTNVSLILSDETLYSHKGTLQLQEVSVDENTGSVTLRAIFPNDENILLPGMFVKATIEGAIDTKAFLLPQQAVSRDEKANPIITVVQDDNSIKRRQITIERAIGNKWVVTSGINNNDKIIIEGLNKINMKSKVNPIDVTNKYIQED